MNEQRWIKNKTYMCVRCNKYAWMTVGMVRIYKDCIYVEKNYTCPRCHSFYSEDQILKSRDIEIPVEYDVCRYDQNFESAKNTIQFKKGYFELNKEIISKLYCGNCKKWEKRDLRNVSWGICLRDNDFYYQSHLCLEIEVKEDAE